MTSCFTLTKRLRRKSFRCFVLHTYIFGWYIYKMTMQIHVLKIVICLIFCRKSQLSSYDFWEVYRQAQCRLQLSMATSKDKHWWSFTCFVWQYGCWKNVLGSMMQRISKDAGLSCVYTNHCIRATCITMLVNVATSLNTLLVFLNINQ